MVPVVYKHPVGHELRVLAFSTSGAVLGDQIVTAATSPTTTGGDDLGWYGACAFPPALLPCIVIAFIDYGTGFEAPAGSGSSELEGVGVPMPGVAIRQDPRGGAPLVVMTDGKHDKIAFSFSPQSGFSQVSRSSHGSSIFTTPPVVQGDRIMVGTSDGALKFTESNFAHVRTIAGLGTLTAAPTRLVDGHIVVVSRGGYLSMIYGLNPVLESQEALAGESIASAAASCTHFFVATTDELATYDTKSLTRVATVPWVDGGLSAPVIGPGGHVYAIVSTNLFVFPPPIKLPQQQGVTACDGPGGSNSPGNQHDPFP